MKIIMKKMKIIKTDSFKVKLIKSTFGINQTKYLPQNNLIFNIVLILSFLLLPVVFVNHAVNYFDFLFLENKSEFKYYGSWFILPTLFLIAVFLSLPPKTLIMYILMYYFVCICWITGFFLSNLVEFVFHFLKTKIKTKYIFYE